MMTGVLVRMLCGSCAAMWIHVPAVAVTRSGPNVTSDSPERKCMIAGVMPNGAAERAGVIPGDVVVRFDGETIESFPDLVGRLMDRAPGDEVDLQVARGGELVDLRVTLGGWEELRTGSEKPPSLRSAPPPEPGADAFLPPEIGPER